MAGDVEANPGSWALKYARCSARGGRTEGGLAGKQRQLADCEDGHEDWEGAREDEARLYYHKTHLHDT